MKVLNRCKIDLKNYGPVLMGRKIAIKLRNEILKADKVILDFEGVQSISRIFADELIGQLAKLKGREVYLNQIQILNATNENLKMLIFVIRQNS